MEQNASIKPSGAAKFVFFYLVHLVSLIAMTISFGVVVFQIINKYVPDALLIYSGSYSDSALKVAISFLLVSTPVFYLISSLIQKSLLKGELKKESAVRRWLTYLILFASFLVFVGWLVAFVNNFLNGELSTKFILKAVAIFVIAAAVFSYYFYDIRREVVENIKSKIVKIYFYSSLAVFVIAIVSVFFVVESPIVAREKKLDEQVMNNFNTIYQCVDNYYRANSSLPNGLADIAPNCDPTAFKDPATGQEIQYNKKNDKTYDLCANFRTSNKNNNQAYPVYYGPGSTQSLHDAGYQCLSTTVLPITATPTK